MLGGERVLDVMDTNGQHRYDRAMADADEYMTVPEVAAFLGISLSGAYKAIERGRMQAFRRSPRQTLVTRHAAEAYRDRGLPAAAPEALSLAELRRRFEAETGMTAREWQDRWKRGEIEETPTTFGVGMTSLTILAAEAAERSPAALSAS